MATRILLIEDEEAIQELIAFSLTQAGYEVFRASDAEQGLQMVQNNLPDLIVLDWMLPKMSGIECARRLRHHERTRTIPIIMLSARNDESDKISGLEFGADDYITKPFSPRELQARVKALLRRRAPQMTDDIVEIQGLILDPNTQRITGNGLLLEMGLTEFKLLHFFMTHPERIYARGQLLDQVWGDHVFIEERTIDVHIRRLRLALTPSGHAHIIQTVRGTGYRFSTQTLN